MEFPDDLLYNTEDEWVRVDGDEVTVGISDFAQDQLGDIVYLELPEVGTAVTSGEPFGIVESVKAVSDLYAPLDGEVLARNDALIEEPQLANSSPYRDGWMITVRIANPAQLDDMLSAGDYRKRLPQL